MLLFSLSKVTVTENGPCGSSEWAVEEEFPATTISSHPNRFSNSATAEFEFSVSKGNCTIFCSLDGGEPMEVGHHLTLRDLAEGKHHVETTNESSRKNRAVPVSTRCRGAGSCTV